MRLPKETPGEHDFLKELRRIANDPECIARREQIVAVRSRYKLSASAVTFIQMLNATSPVPREYIFRHGDVRHTITPHMIYQIIAGSRPFNEAHLDALCHDFWLTGAEEEKFLALGQQYLEACREIPSQPHKPAKKEIAQPKSPTKWNSIKIVTPLQEKLVPLLESRMIGGDNQIYEKLPRGIKGKKLTLSALRHALDIGHSMVEDDLIFGIRPSRDKLKFQEDERSLLRHLLVAVKARPEQIEEVIAAYDACPDAPPMPQATVAEAQPNNRKRHVG